MRDETPRVRTLRFAVPDWPGHRAGQHVDVRLTAEDGYQVERSYSIASPPEDPLLALTVERLEDGEVSPYLTQEVRPGDRLELRGPIGGYFVWEPAMGGPLLLIAGGSGVVPLMSMLRERAGAGSHVPTALLSSSRRREDVIYRDELAALTAADPSLRVVHTLTREQPPGWTGFGRRIDGEMLAEILPAVGTGARAFICGPTLLVEAAAQGVVDLGIPAAQVRTERFGPTGA